MNSSVLSTAPPSALACSPNRTPQIATTDRTTSEATRIENSDAIYDKLTSVYPAGKKDRVHVSAAQLGRSGPLNPHSITIRRDNEEDTYKKIGAEVGWYSLICLNLVAIVLVRDICGYVWMGSHSTSDDHT